MCSHYLLTRGPLIHSYLPGYLSAQVTPETHLPREIQQERVSLSLALSVGRASLACPGTYLAKSVQGRQVACCGLLLPASGRSCQR